MILSIESLERGLAFFIVALSSEIALYIHKISQDYSGFLRIQLLSKF